MLLKRLQNKPYFKTFPKNPLQEGYFGYDCSTYRPVVPDNRCPNDQFYSSETNQCLDCFCFGIRQGDEAKTKCQASNLRKSSVSGISIIVLIFLFCEYDI